MTQFIDVSGEMQKKGKKTVFTHFLTKHDGWIDAAAKPTDFYKVLYLGFCNIEDSNIFAAFHDEGIISIYKGIKGYEFNK